jgi:hypothetical protein
MSLYESFTVSNSTFFSYRQASTLDTSGRIMDFSWYTFTTGAPAPVPSPAMAARCLFALVEELKPVFK